VTKDLALTLCYVWKLNVTIFLRGRGSCGLRWDPVTDFCEDCNELSDSIKSTEFIDLGRGYPVVLNITTILK
jgi:hypothetical protein